MPNSIRFLSDRYIAFSGIGMIQTDNNTPLADAVIDTRHKCTISLEDNVERRDIRDCEDVDLTDQKVITRYKRLRLTYTQVTPQIMAMWMAYYLGQAAAPTGSQANEVQTVTISGDGTLSMDLEGRTVTTATILSTATADDLYAALTAGRMKFIQPGDVEVTGTGPFTVTFPATGRLGRANLPTMTGTGGISVAGSANGSQYYHAFTRATSREKVRFGFALGYLDDDAPDPIKYSGFVVESLTPTVTRRQPVGLTVSILGLFDGDAMPGYSIPDCVSVTGLESADCKVEINNTWQTSDVSTLSAPLNDNVPLDDSAYGFDGIDPDLLARAKQVTYNVNAQIFATEEDAIAQLADNERIQAPVDAKYHFGLPGNRLTILAPETKVKFQSGERFVAVGAAERFAGNFELTAFKDDQDPPISAEAYVDQSVAFLLDTPPGP